MQYMNNYGQNGYMANDYGQGGYMPNDYGQAGYMPNNYGQPGMMPNDYGQMGYMPNDFGQNGGTPVIDGNGGNQPVGQGTENNHQQEDIRPTNVHYNSPGSTPESGLIIQAYEQDEVYYLTPIDLGPSYEYTGDFVGPVEERKCTDICMLVFFILFLCGMLGLFFTALTRSFVMFLYLPTDYHGLICGYNNNNLGLSIPNTSIDINYETKEYLFWTRPGKKGYVRSACVSNCPTVGSFFESYLITALTGGFSTDSSVCYTENGVSVKSSVYDIYLNEYYCEYQTTPVLMRCFPDGLNSSIMDDASYGSNLTSFIADISGLNNAYSDITKTWWIILVLSGAALGLSMIWVISLKWSATFFVWLTVLLSFAGLGFLTYECWKQRESSAVTIEAYTFGFFSQETNRTAFTILFWILIAFDTILLLVFLFACDRIRLSIGITEIVARVFGEISTLFFWPIIPFILYIIWWAYCIGVGVVLFGAGKLSYVEETSGQFGNVVMTYDSLIYGFSIYHFFGLLWGTAFIHALSEMTVAGVFAKFFFSREPRALQLGEYPVWESFKRSIVYHSGSLAFGSLLIAICQAIRLVFEYIDEKTKDSQSTFVQYIMCCIRCCLWCLEKFIRYINRNAYVLITLHGYSFFESAIKAFELILRNPVRATVVSWISSFTFFLGKVFVSAIVGGLSLYWFQSMDNLTFYLIPALFVIFLSFIVCGAFSSLFETGIDTCFLCALEDEENGNDATKGYKRYAPPDLIKLFDESASKPSNSATPAPENPSVLGQSIPIDGASTLAKVI